MDEIKDLIRLDGVPMEDTHWIIQLSFISDVDAYTPSPIEHAVEMGGIWINAPRTGFGFEGDRFYELTDLIGDYSGMDASEVEAAIVEAIEDEVLYLEPVRGIEHSGFWYTGPTYGGYYDARWEGVLVGWLAITRRLAEEFRTGNESDEALVNRVLEWFRGECERYFNGNHLYVAVNVRPNDPRILVKHECDCAGAKLETWIPSCCSDFEIPVDGISLYGFDDDIRREAVELVRFAVNYLEGLGVNVNGVLEATDDVDFLQDGEEQLNDYVKLTVKWVS